MTSIRSGRRLPSFLRDLASPILTDSEQTAGMAPVSYSSTATVRTTITSQTGGTLDVSCRLHSSRRAPSGDTARPVFVLVHGIGMSHRYFARLQAELIPFGDTVVLDLPGFGGMPRPDEPLGVTDFADVIAHALQDAQLSSCIVIGHSMGAQFATELAVQHPELVAAVVLIGPVTDTSHSSAGRNAAVLALDTLLERPVTNLLVGAAYLRCGLRWYLAELPVMLGYRLDERLAAVTQPVLILRGSLDPIASRRWCRRLARAARDGRVVELPGQAHAAHRAGARAVTDAVLQLVEGIPRPPAVPGRTAGGTAEEALPRWRSITVGDRQCRAYVLQHRGVQHETTGEAHAKQVFVLVHGIGMSHRYFLRLGEQLSRHGTVLVIDLPGYGWTRRPAHKLTNPAGAEILAALLDDLGAPSCVVVGHSMGAQTATELAIQRPDLVSRLVLIGAAVDARRRTVPEQALTLGLNSILERPLLNSVQFLDVVRCGPRWYAAQLAVAMAYALEERLPLARQPVLILRGSRDLVAGTRWSRSLADVSRSGSLASIAGAPHSVHHRSPSVVAAHIISFIT